ncbi:type III restriction-modification system endonuclease [Basfia succiniciproducens]|uniref:Type III restriction enzyme n=1 Tax=Basfia succiniciproducens TaxID=653940 RepID=A0A1G5BM39_9PAST|nr:type III restriction-modification system endonuclease [Basfia succiniciproducens]QIM68402.1 restriction endonuclease subunit R [Basfia succiniciproducens]SCX91213.1 type III restriction enzyme [Basfia succiniciproducens]
MSGFNYEKNLPHQEQGIQAVLGVFDHASRRFHQPDENPQIMFGQNQYTANLQKVQNENGIDRALSLDSDGINVLDVSMETGTGKTYTYTKTMFDLHRMLGVFKFIVVVPTLSIKAGTQQFLQSQSLAEHFEQDFGSDYQGIRLKTYVVESQKAAKGKKTHIQTAIDAFVKAENRQEIHVLLINAGMINSPSMSNAGDVALKDLFDNPVEAIAAVRPFVIVDEPHKFPTRESAKTWKNIKQLNPQYILRYGATFNEQYYNLIYRLTAVDAFNDGLVKGVRVFQEEMQGGMEASIKLLSLDSKEAMFELTENGKSKKFVLGKGDDLTQIHSAIFELKIDVMNKTTLVLSNGLELKRGALLNPYSYAQTVQDAMMQRAIAEHFKLERELLVERTTKIKPLTLFFIDDIKGYRKDNEITGSLKEKFESWVKAEAERRLKNETNEFYRAYLQKTLADLSLVHGGYFSKDNSESDDKIEQEINEILHDKQALLSLDNPRRFIFSKWTLREGWDNPNVFQICKLRSSGSQTSKLQEVGRGLRLPVNELMERVREPQYKLNYFVDSSEKDFVAELIGEVNQHSFSETIPQKFDEALEQKILQKYPEIEPLDLMFELVEKGIIDRKKVFTENGYTRLKVAYPQAFEQTLKKDKISKAGEGKDAIKMRVGKYEELKALWELIHHKAILQYKIGSESEFLSLFTAYLRENLTKFKQAGIRTAINETYINNGIMLNRRKENLENDDFIRFNTMSYREFLSELAVSAKIQMNTLHQAFYALRDELNISEFMNQQTINQICGGFNQFLLNHSFSKFELGYQLVNNRIHPTKFTDEKGCAKEVNRADLGIFGDTEKRPSENYLFDEIFFDSEIEHQNIADNEIENVTVFTKIPKNSIKIPVAGGGSYSPDFAYIVKTKSGETLNFVIEAKGVESSDILRKSEERKIKHAEKLFTKIAEKVQVKFLTQFEGDMVAELIRRNI